MTHEQYVQALATCGGARTEIPVKERWRLMQQWREVYAAPFHARTGEWKDGQFEWHVFSRRSTRALNGARAEAAYRAEHPSDVLVIPEDIELAAISISLPYKKDRRPEFEGIYADVYVFPPDYAWTMAYTHEQDMGLGPYFSRREWTR